jgi:hypothetical protein
MHALISGSQCLAWFSLFLTPIQPPGRKITNGFVFNMILEAVNGKITRCGDFP